MYTTNNRFFCFPPYNLVMAFCIVFAVVCLFGRVFFFLFAIASLMLLLLYFFGLQL